MLTVTNAVIEIISTSFVAHCALEQHLLNLSAYAKEILPEVEKRTKKSVKHGTIVTALSRLQYSKKNTANTIPNIVIDDIIITSNLVEVAFEKTTKAQQSLQKLLIQTAESSEFFTVTQGHSELAIFASQKWLDTIETMFTGVHIKIKLTNLSSITMRFSPTYLTEPNILLAILLRFAIKKIVIVELLSTFTEVSLILHETDIETAFSIIHTFKSM